MRASVKLKKDPRRDRMTTPIHLYWKGPHSVYVPCGIAFIASGDGVNKLSRDGGKPEIAEEEVSEGGTETAPMTAAAYLKQFAKRRQRHWFYDTSKTSEEDKRAQFDLPEDPDVQLYRLIGRRMCKYRAVKKTVEPEEKDESIHNGST